MWSGSFQCGLVAFSHEEYNDPPGKRKLVVFVGRNLVRLMKGQELESKVSTVIMMEPAKGAVHCPQAAQVSLQKIPHTLFPFFFLKTVLRFPIGWTGFHIKSSLP